LDGRFSDCPPSRGADRHTLTKRSMLGAGGGQGCIEDSFDGPDHFAILSHGSESELLIGWTLGSGLSFAEAAEQTSVRFFEGACGRCFFGAATCSDDDSDSQLPWGKEIWTKLGEFKFRQPDLMVLPDNLLWMGGPLLDGN
jgi:hypothetical protein